MIGIGAAPAAGKAKHLRSRCLIKGRQLLIAPLSRPLRVDFAASLPHLPKGYEFPVNDNGRWFFGGRKNEK